MAYSHLIRPDFDADFILEKAESQRMGAAGWGRTKDANHNDVIEISHGGTPADFDRVAEAIAAYPVQYADEIVRPKMLEQATALRWEKQQMPTMFMGMPVLTDDVTISRIAASVTLMTADPNSPQERRWKVGPETWMTFTLEMLVGMGGAISTHIQDCFDNEEALHIAIKAAADIDELAVIDIDEGWPV